MGHQRIPLWTYATMAILSLGVAIFAFKYIEAELTSHQVFESSENQLNERAIDIAVLAARQQTDPEVGLGDLLQLKSKIVSNGSNAAEGKTASDQSVKLILSNCTERRNWKTATPSILVVSWDIQYLECTVGEDIIFARIDRVAGRVDAKWVAHFIVPARGERGEAWMDLDRSFGFGSGYNAITTDQY